MILFVYPDAPALIFIGNLVGGSTLVVWVLSGHADVLEFPSVPFSKKHVRSIYIQQY